MAQGRSGKIVSGCPAGVSSYGYRKVSGWENVRTVFYKKNFAVLGDIIEDLVSIIMPSYNTGSYIVESIQSVLNQTYNNWELILVDDCSTDNTDEVVKPFLTDVRIHYIKNEKNLGAALTRNRALQEAKGKWIAFLDSDDLWKPEKLEKQIQFMKNSGYHFSYTNYSEIDENGKPNGTNVTGPRKITRTGFFNYCWPGCLTVMYESKIVKERVQVADIRKNNDYAMWLIISRYATCYLLPENMASYRKRRGSISRQSYFTLVKWHYRMYREAERESFFHAVFNTSRNVFFGLIKKIRYVK